MNQYLKFFSELAVTVLAAIVAALHGDQVISDSEWINIILLLLGAIAVLGAGNFPTGIWQYTKFWVAALTAGFVYLASVIANGNGFLDVTLTQWIQFLLACAGAVGVVAFRGPKTELHSLAQPGV